MTRTPVILAALAAMVLSVSCGEVNTTPVAGSIAAPATGDESWWTVGDSSTYVEWNSGLTSNLSPWVTVNCTTTHGFNYMVGELDIYREPWSNLDNFVARMDVTCRQYVYSCANCRHTTDAAKVTLFNGGSRSPAYNIEAPLTSGLNYVGNFLSGLLVTTDPFNDYVKNLGMYQLAIYDNPYTGVPEYSSWNTMYFTIDGLAYGNPLLDKLVPLQCPSSMVMSGVALKYDTKKGKIRRLRVICRELDETPLY